MPRAQVEDVVIDSQGRPKAGATVTINVVPGAEGSATAFQGETGAGTISPVVTNELGAFSVWLEEGRYVITAGGMSKNYEVINQTSVAAGSVANGSITEAKLASEAVGEGKIKAEAVSKGKLSSAVQTELGEKGTVGVEGITTEKIKNVAVTEAKIASEAVSEAKLKAGAVSKAKLATALAEEIEGKAAGLVSVNERTAEYTLVLADAEKCIEVNKASETKILVPKNSEVAFPVGTVIELAQIGSAKILVEGKTEVTVNNPSTAKSRAQWSTLGLRKRATNSWVLSGDVE